MFNNMSDTQSFVLFCSIGAAIVASLFDCYYTGLGIAKGLKEANPINAWLFAKIGQALTAFLEIAAVIWTAGLIGGFVSMKGGIAYALGIAGLETYMAIRGKKLLG